MDLSGYSLADLRKLEQSVNIELQRKQAQEVEKAREEIRAIARGVGMTVEELLRQTMPAKVPRPPRYVNPEDASQTWSGAGKQPSWVRRHVAAGGLLEALRIPGAK
jgi:DNA-binding protein H-NS